MHPMEAICSVWCASGDEVSKSCLQPMAAPNPRMVRDPVSGSKYPDKDNYPITNDKRGTPFGVNTTTMQTPIPIQVGGGTPFGPDAKYPAGPSDLLVAPSRYQRFAAIAHIRPESTSVTIGKISRQSRQYVRDSMPDKRPFNAFGNPVSPSGRDTGSYTRGDAIPPALQQPLYNYNSLDTNYLQEQYDTLVAKAVLMERGG